MRKLPSNGMAPAFAAALVMGLTTASPVLPQDAGTQAGSVELGRSSAGISPHRYGLGESAGGYSAAGSGGRGERAGRYGFGSGYGDSAFGAGIFRDPNGRINSTAPGGSNPQYQGQPGNSASGAATLSPKQPARASLRVDNRVTNGRQAGNAPAQGN